MSCDSHAHTAARILAYLRKQDTEAHPGGELRRKVFADVERHCIDFPNRRKRASDFIDLASPMITALPPPRFNPEIEFL